MFLSNLSLQDFRNYTKSEFAFTSGLNFIIGENTSGKTNLLESIYLLSKGKSFKTSNDLDLINLNENLAKITSEVIFLGDIKKLEILIRNPQKLGLNAQVKKYLVNGVSKRKADFEGNLPLVLFSPQDVEIISGSPGNRRNFLDEVLIDADSEYRHSLSLYQKALRARNKLLETCLPAGREAKEDQFEYWDNLLIEKGQLIAQKREQFIEFANKSKKDIFEFKMFYDKSEISKERLNKYKEAELGSGVTLVGPHRDDFLIQMYPNQNIVDTSELVDVRSFGSRGQQRLVVLQLKTLQLLFLKKTLGFYPLLLLDDIFSELDERHINHILNLIGEAQTIITTTHREFIGNKLLKAQNVIELKK